MEPEDGDKKEDGKEDVAPKKEDEIKEDDAPKKEEPKAPENEEPQNKGDAAAPPKPAGPVPKEADEWLKMVKLGVPVGGVKIKMKGKGADPDKLEEWMEISGIKGPPLEPVQEEPADDGAEKEVILKGTCIDFDGESGCGLIAVGMEEEKGGGIQYFTVSKEEVFGADGGQSIAKGAAVEFVVFEEDDGTLTAVCVTGPGGGYVDAPKMEENRERVDQKEEDIEDGVAGNGGNDGFDGNEPDRFSQY